MMLNAIQKNISVCVGGVGGVRQHTEIITYKAMCECGVWSEAHDNHRKK